MKSHTFIRGVLLSGALMLVDASAALASGSTGTSTTTPPTTTGENTPLNLTGAGSSLQHVGGGSTSASLVRTIVGLFIVIAVIYGITWVMRQVKGGKVARATGNGLSSVATLPLGSNKSLSLVRIGSELVLVGVSENSVTPIRTYTEQEAADGGIRLDDLEGAIDPADRPATRLLEQLRRLTARS